MEIAANDFKLLATRPREDCSENYCNNLERGEIYPFYTNYKFTKDHTGLVTRITQLKVDEGIYTKKKSLQVNVSAVVGKNGSGKSTLVELLFLSCYFLARNNGLLNIDTGHWRGLKEMEQIPAMLSGLHLEIYFQKGSTFNCIVFDSAFQQPKESEVTFYDAQQLEKIDLSELFYTIAVNYSIHGLNEDVIGIWVRRLFHKNDGYQTPVVINPYRENGSINVNGELHFAQIRLLTNLMLNKANQGEILPGKRVTELRFIIDRKKLDRVEGFAYDIVCQILTQQENKNELGIFKDIYEQLLGISVDHNHEDTLVNSDWRGLTIRYVIRKLVRIVIKYPDYRDKYYISHTSDNIPGITNLQGLISDLKKDHSHITLKLRQALNFYRFDPLRMDDPRISLNEDRIMIPVDLFAERLEKIKGKLPEGDMAEIIPVAPFTPRVIVGKWGRFDKLSSGEQQYIHTIQAIAYHILNLNSVFKIPADSDKAKYERINIVLDEIELYFHPEYQRRFLNDLLEYIDHLVIPSITGINLLLLTHSPFILSDIPATNVLRMADGEAVPSEIRTFGGNIHEMLATSFFMEATTGDFAQTQFQRILDWY